MSVYEGSMTTPTAPLAGGKLTGPNVKRYAVTFSSGPTNRYTIAFGAQPALDAGINVPPNTQALTLTEAEVGALIQQDIFAISAVADQTIGLIQCERQ